ncbi:MAG: heme exporter protein CcmA [Firmicutes bacterium]|nr:heme exporter protein CcmA [Bacillota bacterium]
MEIMIKLINIKKRYGEKILYSDLSDCLKSASCTCITGSNGSGKSTLLKIIGSLIAADSGQVAVFQDGNRLKRDEYQRLIGMVAPDLALYDHLNAIENIQFFAGFRNCNLTYETIVDNLFKVGLAGIEDKLVKTFSTGMKQRLKLAVLASSNLPIWLLDEPSSNLDLEGKSMVKKLIQESVDSGKLVILATNEEQEVEYASHILNLAKH